MECEPEDINAEPEELTSQQRGARKQKDYTYRWVRCDVCNTNFKAKNSGGVSRRFCGDECSRRYYNQRHVPRETIDAEYDKAKYQIITDAEPDEDARYTTASRFGIMQLAYMICENAIKSGSVVKNIKTEELFRIDCSRVPHTRRTPSYVIKKALIKIN